MHGALDVQDSGAFDVVVECISARVADFLTSAVTIYTIGYQYETILVARLGFNSRMGNTRGILL